MATHLEKELRAVISSPFEVFLTHAARRIQDRTGALEAAVPERDLQDLKSVSFFNHCPANRIDFVCALWRLAETDALL